MRSFTNFRPAWRKAEKARLHAKAEGRIPTSPVADVLQAEATKEVGLSISRAGESCTAVHRASPLLLLPLNQLLSWLSHILLNTLRSLDHTQPEHKLEGVAYQLTHNEKLGFKQIDEAADDFHVLIPFHDWPVDITKHPKDFRSRLAIGFEDTLEMGIKRITDLHAQSKGGIGPGKEVFIDISMLYAGDWPRFFTARGSNDAAVDVDNCLAHKIGAAIDKIPADLKPVVRFIMGDPSPKSRDEIKRDVTAAFWPGNNGDCVVKEQNAEIHVAFYSPAFAKE